MTSQKNLGKATQAIHAGERQPSSTEKSGTPLLPPLYQNSTFRFTTAAECAEAFRDEESGYVYTRWGNPTQEVLETKLAVLEAGEAALATASGMGAVSTALLTALTDGGHVVAMANLYSATFQILNEDLPRFGIETTFVDATDPSHIARAIRPDTKVLYLESPTNPLLKLIDLRMSAEIAKAHGVTSIIDNTFATPCGQQPITFGIDVVVHSMTKYLSGTGAVIAGAIIGQKEFITRAKTGALRNFGAVISPFNAWLTLHGITTLPLRCARHCENAMHVAAFLETHPAVAWVRYPGLPSHPQHELAKRQMEAFGGMITLELKGGRAAGEHLVDHLQRCALAVSLGTCGPSFAILHQQHIHTFQQKFGNELVLQTGWSESPSGWKMLKILLPTSNKH